MQEVLHLANSDLQEAATTAFIKIIEKQIVPANVYAQTFLQTIQLNVDNRDPGKNKGWHLREIVGNKMDLDQLLTNSAGVLLYRSIPS